MKTQWAKTFARFIMIDLMCLAVFSSAQTAKPITQTGTRDTTWHRKPANIKLLPAIKTVLPPDKMIINKKQPIKFVPFTFEELKVFNNNNRVSGATRITLKSGKVITGGALLDSLNKFESFYNQIGYSIRKNAVVKIGNFLINKALISDRKKLFDEQIKPSTWSTSESQKMLQSFSLNRTDSSKVLENIAQDINKTKSQKLWMTTQSEQPKIIPLDIHQTWSQELGDPDVFAIGHGASFKLNADHQKISSDSHSDFHLYLFGHKFNMLSANGHVMSPSIEAGAFSNTAEFDWQVLGFDIEKKSQESFAAGAPKHEIGQSVEFPFTIGPIPCSIEVGCRAALTFNYKLEALKFAIASSFGPELQITGWAEAAVDAYVAEVGVGMNMTFISGNYSIDAQVAVNFDQNRRYKEMPIPYYSSSVHSPFNMSGLFGSFYVYGEIDLLFHSFRGTHEFYNYDADFAKVGEIEDLATKIDTLYMWDVKDFTLVISPWETYEYERIPTYTQMATIGGCVRREFALLINGKIYPMPDLGPNQESYIQIPLSEIYIKTPNLEPITIFGEIEEYFSDIVGDNMHRTVFTNQTNSPIEVAVKSNPKTLTWYCKYYLNPIDENCRTAEVPDSEFVNIKTYSADDPLVGWSCSQSGMTNPLQFFLRYDTKLCSAIPSVKVIFRNQDSAHGRSDLRNTLILIEKPSGAVSDSELDAINGTPITDPQRLKNIELKYNELRAQGLVGPGKDISFPRTANVINPTNTIGKPGINPDPFPKDPNRMQPNPVSQTTANTQSPASGSTTINAPSATKSPAMTAPSLTTNTGQTATKPPASSAPSQTTVPNQTSGQATTKPSATTTPGLTPNAGQTAAKPPTTSTPSQTAVPNQTSGQGTAKPPATITTQVPKAGQTTTSPATTTSSQTSNKLPAPQQTAVKPPASTTPQSPATKSKTPANASPSTGSQTTPPKKP